MTYSTNPLTKTRRRPSSLLDFSSKIKFYSRKIQLEAREWSFALQMLCSLFTYLHSAKGFYGIRMLTQETGDDGGNDLTLTSLSTSPLPPLDITASYSSHPHIASLRSHSLAQSFTLFFSFSSFSSFCSLFLTPSLLSHMMTQNGLM